MTTESTLRVSRELLGNTQLERVGNTPLVRLKKIPAAIPGVQIVGKAEWANPGGSIKDRAALNIVRTAQNNGQLRRGRTLLDATSGNTGIAYAMIGAAEGFSVKLCLPANVSLERRRILAAYGAEVVLTDPNDGSDGAIRKARELYSENPDRYFYADQYSNDANWRAHYQTTAPEIWRQTHGRITHFVATLGTSGTFTGCTRRLREFNPEIQCISLQPDSPFHGLEGLKHMASAIVPKIYDPTLADDNLEISTEGSYAMLKRLAREEGLLVGISSGAAVVGALQVARRLERSGWTSHGEAVVVTVFSDSADKYLSERVWE
ncbi:MAG TPA: cysteine synthase family protein [Terriglobales bacterium]|nr:cysteine synthase family protein [Terriglobales bacterium]